MDPEKIRRFDEEMSKAAADRRTAETLARDTRVAAGMGFWRLAFVVAVGILIANVISALVLGIVKVVGPPAP